VTEDPTRAAPVVPTPVALLTPVARKPRAGDEVLLRIEKFDDRGRARAKLGSVDVHVRRARPGELVKARILRRRGDRAEAYALECIEPSPQAIVARCAHFGTCGGCSLQDQRYESQLAGLQRLVVSAFDAQFDVDPVVPAAELFRYRNKMEFTFSSRRWVDLAEPQGAEAGFALGLHAARFYRKVIDVRSCAIQSEPCDRILASARELARAAELAPWDVETHTGLLRHLVLRSARATGEIMVHLVTSSPPDGRADSVDAYAHAILARHPEITTFVHSINTSNASVARGEFTRAIHGEGVIRERACGITFTISADSFFQTNTAQAEVLFEMIREEAGLTGTELVYDLYCGTGAIALILASQARAVVGFEQVPSAVADARANARQNGLANVQFHAGDVQELLASCSEHRPDVVVVDPPRAGLHPRVVPQITQLAPRRIVYVSCNPKTAATDCASLCANGYRVARIRPIDLYPHTPHVECVIRLERMEPRV
jgi:23S rRNA (uracil1939-C5)-methyltransferase